VSPVIKTAGIDPPRAARTARNWLARAMLVAAILVEVD
jgi:hypothetical protein